MPGLGIAMLLLAVSGVLAATASTASSPTPAADGSPVQTNVHYNGADGPSLDVYRTTGGSHRPAVLVVHGGGWIGLSRESTASIARALAGAGFVAFNVDYTLAGPGKPGFRRQPQELRAAIRFIRANASEYGVDPTRIGAYGSSAGGHLAAFVGATGRGRLTRGARLRAVVTWSAPLVLTRRALRTSSHLLYLAAQYLGCAPCPRRARAASPPRRVNRGDPAMMIVNSSREFVPASQARLMARRLGAAGIAHRLLIVPGRLHSPSYSGRTLRPSIAFLRRRLR